MFVNTIWNIWNARNKLIFENVLPSTWHITASLWADIKEINKLSIGHMHNSQDDLLRLHSLRLCGHPSKSPKIIEVLWHTPPPGWIKCNTDGSALGAPGTASCGGVFRNSRGFVKGCFSISIGIAFAFEAELLSVIIAIEAASQRNWNHLWLECDSTYVVGLLNTKSEEVPWNYRNRWVGVLHKLKSMFFVASHIFREGNQVADALSKSKDHFNWCPTATPSISPLIARDLNFLPYFRFSI